ncbi:MAG: hypothetical protein FJ384_01035 [Verrucomicrobia bacterium]|nr:hypothetical protein [Verrucomicrobiota bacterium]
MSVVAPVDRVLARIARGDDVAAASSAEGLVCRRDVSVDAHYDGKPVCTVTLPWIVDGHALLQADETVAASVAEQRLASLTAALAMPVRVLRRPLAA